MKLPLYPLKGYSLDAPIDPEHSAPRASITDFERKVLYARIGSRLRVAAMVDLVGQSEAIDQGRLQSLLRVAQTDMPRAGDYARAQPWAACGLPRPAAPPSSAPAAYPACG